MILFIPGSSNHLTQASLLTLRIFLEKYPVPSVIDVFRQSSVHASNILTFENQVLEWLFAKKSDDSSTSQVLAIDADVMTVEEFTSVLVLLCLKNCELRNHNQLQTLISGR